jgi:hypothetical protein
MMLANRAREWFLLGIIFALLPGIFFVFVVLRGRKNMGAFKARQGEIEQQMQAFVPVQPLSAAERQMLADSRAPWRSRMPYLEGDAARLWHYHRTVTQLQGVFRQGGVSTGSVRSSFDPVRGSFTLPSNLGSLAPEPLGLGGQMGKTQAWVLEISVEGPSAQLFKALDLLPAVDPVLEPLALRWEATPEGHKQHLLLRNLVLVP